MRLLRNLAAAVLCGALFTPTTVAQCTPFGPGCAVSRMNLSCSAARIGMNWTVAEQNAGACGGTGTNPVPMLTVFGTCQSPGIPLGPPITCASCGGCELNVLPIDFVLQWVWPPRTTLVPIPNNPRLVGYQFCLQNACVDPLTFCLCLSGAGQITITV